MDKPKELYDAELERMNAAMTQENMALQHDNKQLNALIREYEQTLETLMNTFRNRAKDVQERELALAREYESQLLARQEDNDSQDLGSSTTVYEALRRISHVLRQLLRVQAGEPPEPEPEPESQPELPVAAKVDLIPEIKALAVEDREPWTTLAAREPWTAPAVTGADAALEREIELARLEKENEELRRMLGVVPPQTSATRSPIEMGNHNSHNNFNSGVAGRLQQPQPRAFEPPMQMGGFFSTPRRQPLGANQTQVPSILQRARPLGPSV
ncbi:hypothetical protein C8J57DRAFT_1280297, partial [Mycena rebaudengoi]